MNQAEFVCPHTKLPLKQASKIDLLSINQRIGDKIAYKINGDIVKVPVVSGYMRSDAKIFYSETAGVPDLRYYHAIDLSNGELIKSYVHTHGDNQVKFISEFDYWIKLRTMPYGWYNLHLQTIFPEYFDLPVEAVKGKRILDIGCGPLGSLEWADLASYRVGLDPLAITYRQLGTRSHKMNYVASDCEAIPFPDGYFDYVSSCNSIDHVDNLDAVIAEISRVTAANGHFFLLCDIHDQPTVCEPQAISWDIATKFTEFEVVREVHLEKHLEGMYQSLQTRKIYDHNNPSKRYGIILLILRRKDHQQKSSHSNKVIELLDHVTLDSFPLTEHILIPMLLKTPVYIREIIHEIIAMRLNHKNQTEADLSKELLKIITNIGIKNFAEKFDSEEKRERAFAEFYLNYGFVSIEIAKCIQQLATVDAQDRLASNSVEDILQSAKKLLLSW